MDYQVTIRNEQEVYIELYLMAEDNGSAEETGKVSGNITNAVTGQIIPEVALTLRRGWNHVSGEETVASLVTDGNGHYETELPGGNYTVLMEKNGYISGHFNITVTGGCVLNGNGTLNPSSESTIPSGEMRIILTWGETPRDLDSHLTGPSVDGNGQFHVWYANKDYIEGDQMAANLDLDDTTSFGPETVTVYQMSTRGIYRYYVHDFTNKANGSSRQMSDSGAQVNVYFGEVLYATFHVPADQAGTRWHVFDLDAGRKILTPVNEMAHGSVPSSSRMMEKG